MGSLLLSKLTKDFLNTDSDLVPQKERYRLGWSGSILIHNPNKKEPLLLSLKKRLASLFTNVKTRVVPLSTSPSLDAPIEFAKADFCTPRYFSKGSLDSDKTKSPDPIFSLLMETSEFSKIRPVPSKRPLLRSLCKGKGVLKQNSQGFIYLDIDNYFIHMISPYLAHQGLVKPPYFNLLTSPNGAHIPVILHRESKFHYLDKIEEIGEEFSFEVEGLYSMQAALWPEVDEVWFFKIRSSSLEHLRKKYFLPSLPGGNSFHIAVAIKPYPTTMQITSYPPLMRINPSAYAC